MVKGVKGFNDVIIVERVVKEVVNIVVDVWLFLEMLVEVFEGFFIFLKVVWELEFGIGFDFFWDWIKV